MAVTCTVLGCTSNYRIHRRRSFYRFPLDPKRCKQWVDASGRPELWEKGPEYLNQHNCICDLHFKDSDRYTKKLRSNAVPVPYDSVTIELLQKHNLILHDNTPPHIEIKEEIDNDVDIIDHGPNPCVDIATMAPEQTHAQTKREMNYQTNIDDGPSFSKSSTAKRKEKSSPSSKDMKKKLQYLQTKCQKNCGDRQSANGFKLFALNLFLSCPNAYRVVRDTVCLPTEKSLRQINIDFDTFINPIVEKCLASKMKRLDESEKYCTIGVATMELQRFLFYHINKDRIIGLHDIGGIQNLGVATKVCVIMARGISLEWEQLISYCFVRKDHNIDLIGVWTDNIIAKVMNIGINVVALVTDIEDSMLHSLITKRNVSPKAPFFYNTVNGKKIYCIFSVPQLVMSLRNALMVHQFEFELLKADWESIKLLYTQEHSEYNHPSLAPKLTESHINPSETEKKDIKYAAQVFSKSVSEALAMEMKAPSSIRNEWQNQIIEGTQKLTGLVNNVFDILNSSTVDHDCRFKKAYTAEPYQVAELNYFMELLNNAQVTDDTGNVITSSIRCIEGLEISIMSIICILRDLRPQGVDSLLTSRLNLDALHSVLDAVKQTAKGGAPKPVEFYKTYRKIFRKQLFQFPSTTNQPDDLNQLLMNVDAKSLTQPALRACKLNNDTCLRIGTVDYRFDLPSTDTFKHICEYLLRKIYKVHKCVAMSRYIHANAAKIDWKSYNSDKTRSYFEIPETFIDLVERMDDRFINVFGKTNSPMIPGVGYSVLLELSSVIFDSPCDCFPYAYLRKLFVRLRLFNITRFFNNHNRRNRPVFDSIDVPVILKDILRPV